MNIKTRGNKRLEFGEGESRYDNCNYKNDTTTSNDNFMKKLCLYMNIPASFRRSMKGLTPVETLY